MCLIERGGFFLIMVPLSLQSTDGFLVFDFAKCTQDVHVAFTGSLGVSVFS